MTYLIGGIIKSIECDLKDLDLEVLPLPFPSLFHSRASLIGECDVTLLDLRTLLACHPLASLLDQFLVVNMSYLFSKSLTKELFYRVSDRIYGIFVL